MMGIINIYTTYYGTVLFSVFHLMNCTYFGIFSLRLTNYIWYNNCTISIKNDHMCICTPIRYEWGTLFIGIYQKTKLESV